MGPIIVYTNDPKKIILTKEEFEKYMQEAYDQGYWRGAAIAHSPFIYTNNGDTIPTIQWKDYITITTSNLEVGDKI